MKASEFIENLVSFTPHKEHFIKAGYGELSEVLLREYQFGYLEEKSNSTDEIINMISNYDLSRISIQNITFKKEISTIGNLYVFGADEGALLGIDTSTSEILLVDRSDCDYVIFPCAVNSESFLSALSIAWETLTLILLNPRKEGNSELRKNAREECTLLAGGERYNGFYISLLGG